MRKRDIVLVDKDNMEIYLTLWNDFAEDFNGSSNPVLALKGVKITDYRFRSLSTMHSTALHVNPDIEETRVLQKWFNLVGRYLEPESISYPINSSILTKTWKTLAQAVEEMQSSRLGEPQYYKTKATITTAKRENCIYTSCPSDGCSKKVSSLPNGKYECTRCQCEYDNFKWRLVLNVSFADFSGEQWVTCFDETAESLLTKNALEVQMLRECDGDAFDEIFSEINFKSFILDLRAKMEACNEGNELKTIVLQASPVSSVDFSRKLLSDIKQMEQRL